jgi:uncharacterized protein (DUF433 family)
MATIDSYPHIDQPVGSPAHLRRLPRIRVAQIAMDYLAYGWSPDEMCRQHPHLTKAEAHSAMAYYFDHQEAVDREIEAEFIEVENARTRDANSSIRTLLRAKGVL